MAREEVKAKKKRADDLPGVAALPSGAVAGGAAGELRVAEAAVSSFSSPLFLSPFLFFFLLSVVPLLSPFLFLLFSLGSFPLVFPVSLSPFLFLGFFSLFHSLSSLLFSSVLSSCSLPSSFFPPLVPLLCLCIYRQRRAVKMPCLCPVRG
jgi:hypothetical protein